MVANEFSVCDSVFLHRAANAEFLESAAVIARHRTVVLTAGAVEVAAI
jgi:hypothetical protein